VGGRFIMEQDTGVDLHFLPRGGRKLRICRHRAGGKQMSTGHLHLEWFDSPTRPNKKEVLQAPLFYLEQDTGVEPAFTAWET